MDDSIKSNINNLVHLLSGRAPEWVGAGTICGGNSCISGSSPEPSVHKNRLEKIFFFYLI